MQYLLPIDVRHNIVAQRFEATVAGKLCRADYRRSGNELQMIHTEVPVEARGRGIAGELVRAALAYAEQERLEVVPLCSYVRSFLQRHPELVHRNLPGGDASIADPKTKAHLVR